MKKNLALILALVMLLGTIFPVLPVVAAEEVNTPAAASDYEPTVSYANIKYSDKLEMMFAIPAPEALDAGNEVKLLVWANKGDSSAYSFHDQNKALLSAEANKETIEGKQYLVFKYVDLTAADMTNTLVARPVIVKTTEGVTSVAKYGDVVEYSVLEYVATAKGAFGGTALADNVLEMLNSMLVFGGLAQKYSGKNYDYLASDELSAIWYVPVINGVEGAKVFGGFFKKGAELATISAPHYDDYAFVSYLDNDGNAIYDIDGDVTNGAQIFAPAEGDLVIKAVYDLLYMKKSDANKVVEGTQYEVFMKAGDTGNQYSPNNGCVGVNLSSPESAAALYPYAALDVIDDPYVAGNKVYRISGNHTASIGLGEDTTTGWQSSFKVKNIPGFGDTVAPIATFEITIARGADGDILDTNLFRIRHRAGGDGYIEIGHFTQDGTFMLYTSGSRDNPTPLPMKVAEKGWTRYVFSIDCATGKLYAFAGDPNGELEFQAGAEKALTTVQFNANLMDAICADDVRIEWVGVGRTSGGFTKEEFDTMLADLNGDGIGETPAVTYTYNEDTNADGVIDEKDAVAVPNKLAIAWCYKQYRSMYFKNFCTYVGSPVDELPEIAKHEHNYVDGKCACGEKDPNYVPPADAITEEKAQELYRQYRALLIKDWDSYIGYVGDYKHTTYNINANAATVPSKNSQQMINNFTDDKLGTYYKEGYEGLTLTLGGIGMNAAKADKENPLNYAGIDVIDDPHQAGNKVYSFNGGVVKDGETLGAYIFHGANVSAAVADFGPYKGSTGTYLANDEVKALFATTPVLTYDMTVGGNGYDRMLETDTIRFRGNSNTFVHLFKIAADGSILICQPNETYTDAVFVDTNVDVNKDAAKDGYTRIVAEVDCAKKVFNLYAANEGEELKVIGTVSGNIWVTASGVSHGAATPATAYKDAENWLTLAANIDRSEFASAVGANDLTEAELGIKPPHEHNFVEGKCECGEEDPNYIAIDSATAQAMYRAYRALLIKDWDSYIGYAGQYVHTTYNINANAATVPSKNSQQMINNFTDDKLGTYYKEGYEGLTLTLGGLGMNAAKADVNNPLNYAGIDVIDDPHQAGNKVYSFNGGVVKDGESLGAYIFHGAKVSAAVAGFGPYKGSTGTLLATDDVKQKFETTPVLTYDITVGGNGYDRMLETDTIRFRGNSDTFVHLFKIAADGSILICQPNEDYTDVVFVDTNVDVNKDAAKDGYTRIVAEVDCAKKVFNLYAANEGEELQVIGTVSGNIWVTASGISHSAATAATAYKDAENWLTLASKIDRSEFATAVGANDLTAEELATADSFKK